MERVPEKLAAAHVALKWYPGDETATGAVKDLAEVRSGKTANVLGNVLAKCLPDERMVQVTVKVEKDAVVIGAQYGQVKMLVEDVLVPSENSRCESAEWADGKALRTEQQRTPVFDVYSRATFRLPKEQGLVARGFLQIEHLTDSQLGEKVLPGARDPFMGERTLAERGPLPTMPALVNAKPEEAGTSERESVWRTFWESFRRWASGYPGS